MSKNSAPTRWTLLDGLRGSYLQRAERHANYTLPRICPPNNYNVNRDSLQYDWQSAGAQAANHIVNRLMLTLFAPSRPFMRLDMSGVDKAELLTKLKATSAQFDEWMAAGEREAMRELDNRPIRTHLFDVLAALVVVGDSLLYLPRDDPESATTFGIREYVARRTPNGRIAELVVKQGIGIDDLTDKAREEYRTGGGVADPDAVLSLYHHITRIDSEHLKHEQWVESIKLSESFTNTYTDDECPWSLLAWNLKRGQHYGSGLVEDYSGDFSALSALSQAEVEGALLASEFRWLVNPGGATKIDDLKNSKNGDALAGVEGDVTLIANSKPGDLQVIANSVAERVRRIGRGFLMPSAMTRDAERVTTEEIRMQAQELETGLGGAYTRLASTVQPAVARWLLKLAKVEIGGTAVTLSIITGLDALSRNGDLANLRDALSDIVGLNQLGDLQRGLKMPAIYTAIFLGHGVDPKEYVKSPEEMQAQAKEDEDAAARQAQNEAQARNPQ